MPLKDFAASKVAPNKHLSLYNAEPAALSRALLDIRRFGEGRLAFEISRLAGMYKYYNLVQRGSGASAPIITIQCCIKLILKAAKMILDNLSTLATLDKLATSSRTELRGSVEAIRAEMLKQRDFSSPTIATGHFLHKETALLFVGAMDQAYLIFEPEIKDARNRIGGLASCMDTLELSTDRLLDNGKDLISKSYRALDSMPLGSVCDLGGVGVGNGGRSRRDTPDLECLEVIAKEPKAKRMRFS